MKFNLLNILNLLEAKQGNFDVKQGDKKSTIDFSNDLSLSAVFSTILTEIISRSTNANSEANQNDIFKVLPSFVSNQMNIEISQKSELKGANAEVKNETAEFSNLMQKFLGKQGNIQTLIPEVNIFLSSSIRSDLEVENYDKTSTEFTSNAKGRANEYVLNFIPKPWERISSKDVAKAGMNVNLGKIENFAFDLVTGRGVFAHDLKGHQVISLETISQNKKKVEKPLDKAVATSDDGNNLARAIESRVLFDGSGSLAIKSRGESKVGNDESNFKVKESNAISNNEVREKEETQVVKFSELIHKTDEKIGNVKDNLSAYNGKVDLTAHAGKFEVFEDALEGKFIVKEGVKIQDVVDIVKNTILNRENSKDVELVLRLEPKELGEVVVKISHSEKGLNILFEVKNIEAKHAIESSVNNLKLMLETSNVNLEKVGVMLSDLDLNPGGSRRDYGWRKFSQKKGIDLNEPVKFYGGSLIEAII
jgi:flagellar hook-length control protein FliK